MREYADSKRQLVEVVDAGIHFGAFQSADIGSLQAALQSQLFLGPAKQRPNGTEIGREADPGRLPYSFLGHGCG